MCVCLRFARKCGQSLIVMMMIKRPMRPPPLLTPTVGLLIFSLFVFYGFDARQCNSCKQILYGVMSRVSCNCVSPRFVIIIIIVCPTEKKMAVKLRQKIPVHEQEVVYVDLIMGRFLVTCSKDKSVCFTDLKTSG